MENLFKDVRDPVSFVVDGRDFVISASDLIGRNIGDVYEVRSGGFFPACSLDTRRVISSIERSWREVGQKPIKEYFE